MPLDRCLRSWLDGVGRWGGVPVTEVTIDLVDDLRQLSPVQIEPEVLTLRSRQYLLSREAVPVRKYFVRFDAYRLRLASQTKPGRRPVIVGDTHNKQASMLGGRDKYAEYALRRILEEAGWESRWVDRYQRQIWRGVDTPQSTTDAPLPALVERIRRTKSTLCNQHDYWKSLSGCWDVVAWRGDQLLFVEAKRQGGLGEVRQPGLKRCSDDPINDEQKAWLAAARMLKALPAPVFAIVEWEKTCPSCQSRICFVPEDPCRCPYCRQELPN